MSSLDQLTAEQDQSIAQAMERDGGRLRNYIRKHVVDLEAAEDILQEVFVELVEAYRLVKPIEQVSGWLFRVAKNRIIDRFRGRKLESLSQAKYGEDDDVAVSLEDLLPSPDNGPEAAYARNVLLDEIDEALEEMPPEQRSVFIAHEWEGYSFKELSAETGLSVNTLLSRKHYAVLHLRSRLQSIYEEFVKK
ncbi:MAG TPA: RNA polymerase sigma factor [Acidobacteriaceae bacterium]|jgi:RNA polymerase sigma factor (sigma-70 family)|nr:RNA polymerase sigma factor [Acidobacteriaceae bacterium]